MAEYYRSLDDADSYFNDQLFAADWTGATDANKIKALKQAARSLDSLRWKGYKKPVFDALDADSSATVATLEAADADQAKQCHTLHAIRIGHLDRQNHRSRWNRNFFHYRRHSVRRGGGYDTNGHRRSGGRGRQWLHGRRHCGLRRDPGFGRCDIDIFGRLRQRAGPQRTPYGYGRRYFSN